MMTPKRASRPVCICVCARAIVHIFGYHSMGVSLHVSSPCVSAVCALQRIPCLTCTRQTGSQAGSCRCTSPRKRTWSVLTGDSDPLACGSEESSPSMRVCVRVPDWSWTVLHAAVFHFWCPMCPNMTQKNKKTNIIICQHRTRVTLELKVKPAYVYVYMFHVTHFVIWLAVIAAVFKLTF